MRLADHEYEPFWPVGLEEISVGPTGANYTIHRTLRDDRCKRCPEEFPGRFSASWHPHIIEEVPV